MSILVPIEAKSQSVKAKLSTTDATDLYTGIAGITGKIVSLRLVNIDASNACDVTVGIYDASEAATYTWHPTTSLAASATLDLDFNGFKLDDDDKVQVTAGAADDIEAFLIVAETQGRAGATR